MTAWINRVKPHISSISWCWNMAYSCCHMVAKVFNMVARLWPDSYNGDTNRLDVW